MELKENYIMRENKFFKELQVIEQTKLSNLTQSASNSNQIPVEFNTEMFSTAQDRNMI